MDPRRLCCSVLLLCIAASFAIADEDAAPAQETEKFITRARVEACTGCRLNALPEVKGFVQEDIPEYANVEYKGVPGKDPILYFLTESDEVVEEIYLRPLTRQQCNDQLKSHGFKRRSEMTEQELSQSEQQEEDVTEGRDEL